MGLNETLERLEKERQLKELSEREPICEQQLTEKERNLAERIFFDKMLKEINHGMGTDKIDRMITRSINIAKLLHNRLYQ